ncbi:MAG: hypothetical protein GY786_20680 [Proteobacteria bacterium]|nr:hypothetical protein [Pseudomonadota bacterium]
MLPLTIRKRTIIADDIAPIQTTHRGVGPYPYGPEAERANSTMKEDLKILENPESSRLKEPLSWLKLQLLSCCSAVLLNLLSKPLSCLQNFTKLTTRPSKIS